MTTQPATRMKETERIVAGPGPAAGRWGAARSGRRP